MPANRERDAFDLPIGPRVFDFGQPVLNVMFEANPIKNMLEGEAVALVIGKLNAIVSQNHVNDIWCQWRRQIVPHGGVKVYQSG